jgi:pantothenate synthetase
MADRINDEIRNVLNSDPLVSVDYVEIVDADSFLPVPRLRGSCLAVLAAFVGSTRLIDNMRIEERSAVVTCSI